MISPIHSASDWRIAGEPALDWLYGHRADLVERALDALGDVEEAGKHRNPQLRWIVDYNLRLFIRVLEDPTVPVDEETAADLVASAARRASEGAPIEVLLEDYITGMASTLKAVADHTQPAEIASLKAMTEAVFTYMRDVATLVVRGFQHEAAGISLGERDARFAVYSALLNGTDPEQVAQRAGIALAARYLVLAIRMDPVPLSVEDDQRPTQVAERRRANVVQRVLSQHAEGDVLALVRDPVGTALVPLPSSAWPDALAWSQKLIDELAGALGTPVHVGAAVATPLSVPAAVTQSEDVLELVSALGLAPGVWFLRDVLLPYQLTRPGPARDLLAEQMSALDSHPVWEETLRVYLATGFDRRRTAEELHVHPNTVDYRLGRVADVCGIDPVDAASRPVALAALHVRDLAAYVDGHG